MTTAYLNGQFLPLEQAHISPLDRGFLYGDGVYEVIRAYRGRPFRLDRHFARLTDSCAKMRMGIYLTPLREVPLRLLEANGLAESEALIYLHVTRGAAPRRHHWFPSPDVKPTVFGMAWEFQPNPEWYEPGLTVITVSDDRWARCDIKTTALVPNVLAHQRARDAGAHEAIYVRDGAVTEGTLSNAWAVFGEEVRTAPLTNYVLPGIKRAVVLELCGQHGIPVRESPILQPELADADELFITGTMHDVAPIHSIDGRVMARERPVTERLRRLFRETVERECGLA
jgi:D-alanine transaminase